MVQGCERAMRSQHLVAQGIAERSDELWDVLVLDETVLLRVRVRLQLPRPKRVFQSRPFLGSERRLHTKLGVAVRRVESTPCTQLKGACSWRRHLPSPSSLLRAQTTANTSPTSLRQSLARPTTVANTAPSD